MKLVQILLPVRDNDGRKFKRSLYTKLHHELVSRLVLVIPSGPTLERSATVLSYEAARRTGGSDTARDLHAALIGAV